MIKKTYFIFILICCLFAVYAEHASSDAIQPIKKIYLKVENDKNYFCLDFVDDITFSPRIHILPSGAKLVLSFNKPIKAPSSKKLRNHKLINGYFFEKVGNSSLLMVLSLKDKINFIEKRYTKNSIKLCFEIPTKYNIVIDAGHGGKDPGTKCLSGDYEKNITLIAAIELRNKLLESGRYNVILTRDNDKFVPINERKEKAKKADLLISLHTDNNQNKNVRGMSIYTLPNLDLVKNKSSLPQKEIDDYYKNLSNSRKFANILMSYTPTICKLKKHPRRNVELKILKVPYTAVLIELGCVSNEIDNQLLHSRSFREKTNHAILYALDEFFNKTKNKKDKNKALKR